MQTKTLIVLALIGSLLIIFSTMYWGIGVTSDSVLYINSARSLLSGHGLLNIDDSPYTINPPLYPIILAFIGYLFDLDPFIVAPSINAIIYGAIILISGKIIFSLINNPIIAYSTLTIIIFSKPVYMVSIFAWTEALFIFLTVITLINFMNYDSKPTIRNLVYSAVPISLAGITRYASFPLFIWGGVIILIANKKIKWTHLLIYSPIVITPIGLWLLRNYYKTQTYFGFRFPFENPISLNLGNLFTTIQDWYFPEFPSYQILILTITLGIISFMFFKKTSFNIGEDFPSRSSRKPTFITICCTFILIYITFIVISATKTSISIDSRMLSPIYIPLTILVFCLLDFKFQRNLDKLSWNKYNFLTVMLMFSFFVYQAELTIKQSIIYHKNGIGYSGSTWKDNKTIAYINENIEKFAECQLYSKDPWVINFLTGKKAYRNPLNGNLTDDYLSLSSLEGTWPEQVNACIVDLDPITWNWMYSAYDLSTITTLEVIAELKDGKIYFVTRK